MQNYWDRYDWLTRAYAFKCVGAYESQILVDFTDNPSDAAASRHARLYLPPLLSLSLCGFMLPQVKKPEGAVDEISWKNDEELVTLLYWDTWESWCGAPPSLRLAHTVSVWERDPPDVSLGISLGRQLEGGADSWHGAAGAGLAVTFWRVWGGFMFRSHVQCFGGLIWYPTESVGGRGSAQSFSVSTTNRIDTRIGDRLSGNIIYPSIEYAPQSSPAA